MSADLATVLSPSPRAASPQPASQSKSWPMACMAVALLALLAAHFDTASAIVGLWMRSATFAHGFLIPPIAAWLIWRQRDRVASVPRRPSPWTLLPMTALGMAWLLSTVANVQVLQQYCFVLLLAGTVGAVLGFSFVRAIAFPLAYLLLSVPFGEIFVPPLIDFTSRFTVALLQLVGIPVFRENNYLSLPTGNWSVVDACSGLRYVIASLALGTLYAYLTYRSVGRRLIFIAVSLVLPIFANGLRACMIVLIGHWSNMTLAVGIDHLIYGWVFFGLVSALLFWCGARWREPDWPPAQVHGRSSTLPAIAAPASFVRITAATVAVIAIWPLLAVITLRPTPPDLTPEPKLTLAPAPAPWRASQMRPTDWHALHMGQPQRVAANYSDGRRTVSLQLTWYRHQAKGAELLAPVRRMVIPGLPQWNEISTTQRRITVGARTYTVRQTVEQAAGVKLLVWRWYRQAGVDTSSPQLIKLMLAKTKLFGGADGGAEIVVATLYDEQAEPAEAALRDFLTAMLPTIDQGLLHVAR
jgi:exosortase A